DERLIEQLRDFLVGERLLLHYMAPVTRRITDREEDRLVEFLGEREGRVSPGMPVDRGFGVLEKIQTLLVREMILARLRFAGGRCCGRRIRFLSDSRDGWN